MDQNTSGRLRSIGLLPEQSTWGASRAGREVEKIGILRVENSAREAILARTYINVRPATFVSITARLFDLFLLSTV